MNNRPSLSSDNKVYIVVALIGLVGTLGSEWVRGWWDKQPKKKS